MVWLRQRRAGEPLHDIAEVFLVDVVDGRRRRLLVVCLLLLLNNAAAGPLDGFSDLAALPVDAEIVRIFAIVVGVIVGPSAAAAAGSVHFVSLVYCHSKVF